PNIPAGAQVVALRAGSNLVITAPQSAPIAGGVRALRFYADNNESIVTIESDAWNMIPNALPLGLPGAGQLNRALFVTADQTQIVLNGNYVAEQRRREALATTPVAGSSPYDAINGNLRGSFTTVFNTPLTSGANPPAPWVGGAAPAAGENAGGLWIEIITAANQNGPTRLGTATTQHNIIGPIGVVP
ncbi:MAG: hypothetical protein P8M70_08880, partial [Verrucomicrobiota bacterium]|nr:hypothetical protein [Verrucomicrobiota bacterium]